ncbi:MAG: exodeoxyribonuclease VII small subunit [Anaerohalosphaeraceae bacterium]
MAKSDKKTEELSFEQAIDQLNQIVSRIEMGQVPLQESLEQYEKGMKMIRYCRGILQDAEKRIEMISAKEEQKPAESDPSGSNDKDDDSNDELF